MSDPVTEEGFKHILVVEDDPALLKLLVKILQPFGDVTVAKDGQEAVDALTNEEHPPDLIVTDIMMPRLDGLGMMKRLNEDKRLSKIPVVILSAKGKPLDVVTGINAGARHYVTKPFKVPELLDKVKKALRIP